MSPQEALKLLDQAAAAASSNRSGHATLLEAVKVLQQLVNNAALGPINDQQPGPPPAS